MMLDWDMFFESPFFYIFTAIVTIFCVVIATLFILIHQSRRRLNTVETSETNDSTPEPELKCAGEGDQKHSEEEEEEGEEEEEEEEEEIEVEDAIIDHNEIEPCEELTQEAEHPALENPGTYTDHIQGKVKQARAKYITKQIEKKMTPNQIAEERETQRKQLEAIYSLMKDNQTKFGLNSMDDIDEQFKLYA